ncbi:MAG: ATP-binding cassette domain-containing protein [Candidatus Omnitrophica bacterium]|jgi:iron complex transport system ATP-binding protein|nr:ATP-binding cassette domain-containing protein [Candidatus Omnitrophota bacterium]
MIPLLEFNNITVTRDRKKILDSISVKIYPGEHIAILGPNGAGKSSFIKTITREYYPLQAKDSVFRIWGRDIWNIFDLRTTLGIVSNDLQYSFERDMSGMEMILSGFFSSIGLYRQFITPEMRRKAKEVMEFLEISSIKDRSLTQMSSGEARRFLIGRALVHDPKALILDEPVNSLDLHALHKFRQILGKLSRSGIGVILVTHNLSDIIPEISRVILMKEGKFYKDGAKAGLLTDQNISKLFNMRLKVKRIKGYYYAFAG